MTTVVGTTDLSQPFKSVGGITLNGVHKQLDTENKNDVVRGINERTSQHGVTASLDAGHHLQLDCAGAITIAGDAGVLTPLGLTAGTF